MRLPTEVIAAVRRAAGEDFPSASGSTPRSASRTATRSSTPGRSPSASRASAPTTCRSSAGGKFEDAIHKAAIPCTRTPATRGSVHAAGLLPRRREQHLAAGVRAFLRSRGMPTPRRDSGKTDRRARRRRSSSGATRPDRDGARSSAIPTGRGRSGRGARGRSSAASTATSARTWTRTSRKSVCVLWPAGHLQAPESRDSAPPTWPSGRELVATAKAGRVSLFMEAGRGRRGRLRVRDPPRGGGALPTSPP